MKKVIVVGLLLSVLGSDIFGSNFAIDNDYSHQIFNNKVLTNANFGINNKFNNANFKGANLTNANFGINNKFNNANFKGANLTNANFGINNNLNQAIFDTTTIMPNGKKYNPKLSITQQSHVPNHFFRERHRK